MTYITIVVTAAVIVYLFTALARPRRRPPSACVGTMCWSRLSRGSSIRLTRSRSSGIGFGCARHATPLTPSRSPAAMQIFSPATKTGPHRGSEGRQCGAADRSQAALRSQQCFRSALAVAGRLCDGPRIVTLRPRAQGKSQERTRAQAGGAARTLRQSPLSTASGSPKCIELSRASKAPFNAQKGVSR